MDSRGAKLFKFNLIPPKSKEEIAQLVERDNSILYAFLLIFFSAVVYFVLTLLDSALVQPSLLNTKNLISTQNAQIASYNQIKSENGELFIKSKALEPLLTKDIKLSDLLSIADNLDNAFGDSVNVQNYKRETTGEFVLTLQISDSSVVKQIVTLLASTTNVKDVFIRSVGVDSGDPTKFSMVVAFNIDKLQ